MKRHELHVYSEEAMAALQFFLSHVVLPRKRERYLALIAHPQSRHKFLSTFHHKLFFDLDPAKRIEALTAKQIQLPGYFFSPYNHDCLGDAVDTLHEILSTDKESFLLITSDGTFGVYGPEDYINDREYYAA